MRRAGLVGRVILISDGEIALAELADGEREAVNKLCELPFAEDADDRPVLFQLAEWQAALLEAATGKLLGTMVWRALPYGSTMACTAWNIGIRLLPTARGRGLSGVAGRLLARHLFATTDLDRVEANTEVANVPGWRGLEEAGFHREGVTRGVTMRGGQRRDMFLYSMLRSDLECATGERTVLARRDGVALAQSWPSDHDEILAAATPDGFAPDPDRRLSPATPPSALRGAVLDDGTGRLLGTIRWYAVDYGGTLGCAAWNIGITLLPHARGRGVGTVAQRLLAEHLFATTELDRVEAWTDVDNLAERRALEKAGFRCDGVIRGARLRDGQRRDVVHYGILRADLFDQSETAGVVTADTADLGVP